MMRTWSGVVLVLLALGCGGRQGGPAEDGPRVLGPTVVAPSAPVPDDAFEATLVPEDLKSRLALHDYSATRSEKGFGVVAVVENLQATDPLTVELCVRFVDEAGAPVLQTEWSRATVPAHRRHHFAASTLDPAAADGKLLIRVVELLPR